MSGRFEPLRLIGRGGMGEVWLARDRQSGAEVALKRLPPDALDPLHVARFAREAELLARLVHPGIVRMLGWGVDAGGPWIAMERLEGGSLSEVVRREGPLPWPQAVRLAVAVGKALGHAHAAGVLHRDLKPENVLLDGRGEPRVVDFGLARAIASGGSLTATGTLLGSPGYLAPEAIEDPRRASPASDVYGLGATLHHLLTGLPPFLESSPLLTLRAALTREPEPPSRSRPGLPSWLDEVVVACLARDPARRPGLAAVERELQRHFGPERRRAGLARAAALALACAAAGAGVAVALQVHPASPTQPPAPVDSSGGAVSTRTPAPAAPEDPPERAAARRRALELLARVGQGQLSREEGERVIDVELARHAQVGELLFARARIRFDRGDVEAARRDALAAAPLLVEPEALQPATILLFELGELAPAMTTLDALVARRPDDALARVTRANLLNGLDRLDEALADAEAATKLAPGLATAWTTLSFVRLERGEVAEAARDAERALGLDPGDLAASSCLIQCLRRLGHTERQGELWRALRARTLVDTEQRLLRARLAMDLDDREAALAELYELLSRDQQCQAARVLLRRLSGAAKRQRREEEELGRLAMDTRAALESGELSRATELARAMLGLDPASAQGLILLTLAEHARGEGSWEVHLGAGLALLEPDEWALPLSLAERARSRGDLTLAWAVLSRLPSPEGAQGLHEAWVARLALRRARHEQRELLDDADRLLRAGPSPPYENAARLARIQVHLARSDGTAALADAQAILAREPLHLNARLYAALAREQRGELELARAEVERVLEREAENAEALYLGARLRWRLGDEPGARAAAARLAGLGPGVPGAVELSRKLATELPLR